MVPAERPIATQVMREFPNYKLQIPNKLQKANYKYLVIDICDLPSKNIKMLTIYA
jgi:hypothetical protein